MSDGNVVGRETCELRIIYPGVSFKIYQSLQAWVTAESIINNLSAEYKRKQYPAI
jgi:hypothetical protein